MIHLSSQGDFDEELSTPDFKNLGRRGFFKQTAPLISGALIGGGLLGGSLPQLAAENQLPLPKCFIGISRFESVVKKAKTLNWRSLPIGERIVRFALEFEHVPYVSYSLEIDNYIESPSANLRGMDCWTFFEICLGLARMIEVPKEDYRPEDLLLEIEWTRYRAGRCRGNYLDRIHYLAEWYTENEARSVITNPTRALGGVRMRDRKVQEMTILWKSYRYLKNNPKLRPAMAKSEREVERIPFYFIPKNRVARIENKLRNGDILGIVTRHHGGFCSHVGIGLRDKKGVMRIMHASSNEKKVIIDRSISGYLNHYSSHAGVIVGRPLPRSLAVTEGSEYRKRLRRILRG